MENNLEIIKQTVEGLLKMMNFESEVSIDAADTQNIVINVQTDEAGFLIGQAGNNLAALQHLARLLVNKKLALTLTDQQKEADDQSFLSARFIVDVNNYRKHRVDLLKELAVNMANQALNEDSPLLLQPMPAYERRIIHMSLADRMEVITESTGLGDDRRVIIKPSP